MDGPGVAVLGQAVLGQTVLGQVELGQAVLGQATLAPGFSPAGVVRRPPQRCTPVSCMR